MRVQRIRVSNSYEFPSPCSRGTVVVRAYATRRKVMASRPDEGNEIVSIT
jgi:hypothetical protein